MNSDERSTDEGVKVTSRQFENSQIHQADEVELEKLEGRVSSHEDNHKNVEYQQTLPQTESQ